MTKWLVYDHFISDMNTMTIIEDMMPVVTDMANRRISGTYNVANRGVMSPLEIAQMLKEEVNREMVIKPTTLEEVNRNLVETRCTTVLSTAKLETVGYRLPDVRESMRQTVKVFGENLARAGGLSALDFVRRDTRSKYFIVTNNPTTYDGAN